MSRSRPPWRRLPLRRRLTLRALLYHLAKLGLAEHLAGQVVFLGSPSRSREFHPYDQIAPTAPSLERMERHAASGAARRELRRKQQEGALKT